MSDPPRDPVPPAMPPTAEARPARPTGAASPDDAGDSRALTAISAPPAPRRARSAPGTLPAPAGPPPPATSSPTPPAGRPMTPPRARAATPLPPGLPVVAPYQTRPPTTSRPATPYPFEADATAVSPPPGGDARVELATPTHIDSSPSDAVVARVPQAASAPIAISHAESAPIAAPHTMIARGAERSEPLRVISMKQPGADKPRVEAPRVPLHVQLRSIAEVAGRSAPQELGNLAPPRDPGLPIARARTSIALWVCIGLAIACAFAFAIWLVAGR